ncbi:MAG: hypothetical protein JO270_17915 [Acidobacteriaceae bacterium]|nr:hypothetical protein [Acidobacteriaceae bacterium]
MIFFRVSEEEFQQMEAACARLGARSISDFARAAARRCISESAIDEVRTLLEKLAAFERTLDHLHRKVSQLQLQDADERSGTNLGEK